MAVQLVVPAEDDGVRVDTFLAHAVPALSRRHAKALAKDGGVRREGRVLLGSATVHVGDVLEVELPAHPAGPLPHAQVLHEDARFLYLHKPAGLHTVRLRPDDPPTLADVARAIDPGCETASPDPREAGAVHRLDRSTSGVVAFARTPEAWTWGRAALAGAWKLYLAQADAPPSRWPPAPSAQVTPHLSPPRWPPDTTVPRPPTGGVRITWPLLAVGPRGHRMRVDARGRGAESWVWCVDRERSLFAVELVTGLRHQIRAHMAELGLPLAGDGLYGDAPTDAPARLHAWAYQLGPQEAVVVAAPPPWCVG